MPERRCHFIELTGDGIALLDAAGPAREDQEGGLESVLGIVRVAEDALANAEHETCMPPLDVPPLGDARADRFVQTRRSSRLAPGLGPVPANVVPRWRVRVVSDFR